MSTLRRYRGFILTPSGLNKLQVGVQQCESQTKIKYSARRIAEQSQLIEPNGLHPGTIRKILKGQIGVDQRSIALVFEVLNLSLDETDYAHAGLYQHRNGENGEIDTSVFEQTRLNEHTEQQLDAPLLYDRWEDTAETTSFYGRSAEFKTLEQWIEQSYPVIGILGMGGMGKTSLAARIAKQVQSQFDAVFWKSLRAAPSLPELLSELLKFLSEGQESDLPSSLNESLSHLVNSLRSRRCLLILDDFEALLKDNELAGYYRPGLEAYAELLRKLVETSHQSCIILISREMPKGIAALTGDRVQLLQLQGLRIEESQQLFQEWGTFSGSLQEWRAIVNYYGGNPLMLKLVAPIIQDYLKGELATSLMYLEQQQFMLSDVRDLLEQQLQRLSAAEVSILYWLATCQKPVSLAELRQYLSSRVQRDLLNSLDSLRHRDLIEKVMPEQPDSEELRFTLQPVVMDYVTANFT